DFKELSKTTMQREEHPEALLLQRSLPVVATRLESMNTIVADGFEHIKNQMTTESQEREGMQNSMRQMSLSMQHIQNFMTSYVKAAQTFVIDYNKSLSDQHGIGTTS